MYKGNVSQALSQYQAVGVHGKVAAADRHRLIVMLMDGALEKITAARGSLERGDVPEKAASISRAMAIVDGLRLSLNHEEGGDIAANLENLYEYVNRRLLQANMNSDDAILEEVAGLLGEIKSGWESMDASSVPTPAESAPVPAV